jgi:carboxymethylenebutenolidase
LLLHDVWGLDNHTKNVADRLARQGYHVIAPNLLAGTDMEKRLRPDLRQNLYSPSRRTRSDAQMILQHAMAPLKTPQLASVAIMRAHAAFEYMYAQPRLSGRVAVMGFGFGGTHTFSLAIREHRITAAAAFYPQVNYVAYELRHITCPIMAFYGEQDAAAMASLVRLRPQMKASQVDFTPIIYEGVGSSFFDEEMTGAYDADSSSDAWARSMSFYQKHMS